MTETRPRIGVTGARDASERPAFRAYVAAVEAAGGEPVPILPGGGGSAPLDGLDGLVLTGGRDVAPEAYGQPLRDGLGVDVDAERDALELPLARAAVERDLPVLGICRGIQTLNVALGGTLHQDVVLAGAPVDSHQQRTFHPQPPLDAAVHEVAIEPGSRLREIAGADRLGVNTFHHQVVAAPAPGLRATAWSDEPGRPRLIEAVEAPGRRFVVGVQWHPERMWESKPAQARLFEALMRAAAEARKGRAGEKVSPAGREYLVAEVRRPEALGG